MSTRAKRLIILGVLCALLVVASAGYSLLFNNGGLVYPTDFSTYQFTWRDIPITVSALLTCVYAFYLLISLLVTVFMQWKRPAPRTRKISPKLGILGVLGFAGFGGIWTFARDGSVFPFVFFVFFGFFGFYFEGKMSNTLVDERFVENRNRAQLHAYRTGFLLIFANLLFIGRGMFHGRGDYLAMYLLITNALIIALTLFLSEYLLYRYDYAENGIEE